MSAATVARAPGVGFDPYKRWQSEDVHIVVRGSGRILSVVAAVNVNIVRAAIRCRSDSGTEGGATARGNITRGVLKVPVG